MGISAGDTATRDKASDKTIIIPPISEDKIVSSLWVLPPKLLAIWGTIRPTNAIGPVKDTVKAMIIDVAKKKRGIGLLKAGIKL